MDFPAAHSMDTQWFAVDRDGNVAVFDTGEGGGVPELAALDEGQHFDLAEQLRELPDGGATLDRDGHLRATGEAHCTPSRSDREILAFVDELEPVQDLIARLAATVAPATPGHALRFTTADRAAFDELHARGACRHCEDGWRHLDENGELANHGVFRYSCDESIAAPYVRMATPVQPIAVADAPSEVRAHAIRFDGRFAETPELQPVEHWRTFGWSASWRALDGSLRPFPGRESEFDKEIGHAEPGEKIVREAIQRPLGELVEPPEPAAKKPWWKFW